MGVAPKHQQALVAHDRRNLQRMQSRTPTEGVSEALHEAGLPPTLLGETFATLSLFTAWRDSDEDVRDRKSVV